MNDREKEAIYLTVYGAAFVRCGAREPDMQQAQAYADSFARAAVLAYERDWQASWLGSNRALAARKKTGS